MQFSSILAEAVFCGSALLTVNGSTPYNAVYGGAPRILPGLDQIEQPNESEMGIPGLIGHCHRLREISVQAMVEGSARVRLNRATNTRSTPQALTNIVPGDTLEFFRKQDRKDFPGWFGPAEVLDASKIDRGVVTLKRNGRIFEARSQDVRLPATFFARTLAGAIFLTDDHQSSVRDMEPRGSASFGKPLSR